MHRLPSGQPPMSANLTNAGDRNAPLLSPAIEVPLSTVAVGVLRDN
jgi:hypothetical protein